MWSYLPHLTLLVISCNWSRSQPCALYIRCIVLLLMSSSESPRVQCSGSSLGRRFVRVFRFVDHPSSYDTPFRVSSWTVIYTYVLLHCLVYIYTHHICIGYLPYVSVKIDQMHIKVDTSIYSFQSKLARHIMDTLQVTHLYIPKTLKSK